MTVRPQATQINMCPNPSPDSASIGHARSRVKPRRTAVLFITCLTIADSSEEPQSMSTNHLASERSPYLLQHADNPVDWYPWGEEAFSRAREEVKPIFLSIGYSTCHWCHVMARESFQDEEVAAFLNEHFISVKVDREERPDVDRVYMTYVQATTGSGGWPMSVWLTPDLEPIFGGTYFPPDNRSGRRGFLSILRELARLWKDDREKVLGQGENTVTALRQFAERGTGEPGPLDPEKVLTCYRNLRGAYDEARGGFGGAPKFPQPSNLLLLHWLAATGRDNDSTAKDCLSMSIGTHRAMAAGGMIDHLGGGFHRYSVDATWHVPHFEKMLYDQAQLARTYLELYQLTGDRSWAGIVVGILDYVRRDMTHPDGGFYSAEDADSTDPESGEHAEGAFYVWTAEEIRTALGDDAGVFIRHHGVMEGGNVNPANDPHGEFHGKNILVGRVSIEETARALNLEVEAASALIERSRKTLFDLRERRPRPHLDDKVITAWNGLMISAFARAYRGLGRVADLETARRAAEFVRTHLWDPEAMRLYRNSRGGRGTVQGFCEDYAAFIQGLIDLYEAGGDLQWLNWAFQLQGVQDELFWDETGGGYFDSGSSDPSVLIRMKEDYDGAEPAPSSVAALNLLRLGRMLGRPELEEAARRTIEAFAAQWSKAPQAMPYMLTALGFAVNPSREIVLNGAFGQIEFEALRSETNRRFMPDAVLVYAVDGQVMPDGLWAGIAAESLIVARESEVPMARVCQNFACRLPVSIPVDLAGILDGENSSAQP
jgi:uncharacterized protein YyaL (SSP411 family)